MQSFDIPSQQAMLELGRAWAGALDAGAVVFLSGDLGAGKTMLARGILGGLGHRGATR
ncbi:MAG: tRNA (adenosine(37)-N6)-threonylcarbamoyltransferase complex ATPase subunit type 1 TsaE [bacterium]